MEKGAHEYHNTALIKLITSYPPPASPSGPWGPRRVQNCTKEHVRLQLRVPWPLNCKTGMHLKALSRCVIFLRNSIIYIFNFHLITNAFNPSCKSPQLLSLGHFGLRPFIPNIIIKLPSLSIIGCCFIF